MRRKRLLTLSSVLVLVILVAAGSWIAGSRIQSPAEIAARTAPPAPSPILASVEERTLSSVIVTRGTARFGSPQSISLVPSMLKPDVGVITTVPIRGTQLREGDQFLTVSGRPVFIVEGDVPTFRDLGPGVAGDDVWQLEEALVRSGFDPGPVDGLYDESTGIAVATWYKAAGWEPLGPSAEQLATIRTLEKELAIAKSDKEAADDALVAASLAIDAARANAESTNKVANSEVVIATANHGQITADPNATNEQVLIANAELESAQAMLVASQLEGEVVIQDAINAQKIADRDVTLAQILIIQLSTDLDIARSKTGIQIPADEIIFTPNVPVRVEQIEVAISDAASGPVLIVTNHQLAIDSSLPLNEAALVQVGMPVTIDEPEKGIEAAGVVSRVADTPGTDGVDGFHVYFETSVEGVAPTLEGFSLRLTIPVQSTGGAVMTVPVSALSLATDGSQQVQVYDGGTTRFVQIEAGLAADGYVEVIAVDGTLTPGQEVLIGYENPS